MMEDRPTPPPSAGPPQPYPAYGQPKPARRSTWFWIAIIGGCLALLFVILLILAALAVPQLLKVKKTANQTSAIQTMRSIGQAEMAYNSAWPDSGFACSLAALGGDPNAGAPTDQAAQFIDPQLAASGQKRGYTFSIANCKKVTINDHDTYISYQLTAVPQSVGKTGDRGYCADENNIIKVDTDGGTNCTQPIQ
jgi:type IV pilus assembly protein PilA